jgi:uncharacterized circularly permuted ATP-grasp superfamily protein/uncharacterized alpha-E superfamily protein
LACGCLLLNKPKRMIFQGDLSISFQEYLDTGYWKVFFDSFSQLGQDEILNRRQDMMQFLKENGVTYNIYGDPLGVNRPWKLDIIPFLIGKEEWQLIEAGLIQRATLFDLILKDIYGQRVLLKNGLLPMEIIYNHSGFLRQCSGIRLPGKHHLVLYSADMARGADGKIWVLNDRTQAPSGSGYALENRLTMARIVPELFNGLKVRRLSPYFHSLRNALTAIAPENRKEPRIVILTPGPGNETYFEHAYLSSYLGFTLVQGNDLMVKDNFVWLKTLGGLEKVDVILRRLDDEYCDPLELKADSQLGIPGLLQAVRQGNVSIANPLGSSVIENPGLMPFLPAIARFLLGEELKLHSIASWWCGQPAALRYVLDNIGSLIIKRISRKSNISTSVDATSLTAHELNELKGRIKEHPFLFVGQEKANFAATPSLGNGRIEARDALFRSFAVSNNGSYIAMEGGLTRTSGDIGNYIISNQLGGYSKDTWIISTASGGPFNVHKELDPALENETTYKSEVLPSHTAENLFWVGRYTERVLGNARFQRTVMQLIEEANKAFSDNDETIRQSLLRALTSYTYTFPGFTGIDADEKFKEPWKELGEILFDAEKPGSVAYNLVLFKGAVNAVRDHWSTDTWRVLRDMEEDWQKAFELRQASHHRIIYSLDKLITSMVAFIGLNRESISREQGWALLNMGRKTEQSLLLINMLQATLVKRHDEQIEYILREAVLKSNECLVNYRYKYRSHLKLPLVLDLMLLDPNNPRSLIYQLERLKSYVSGLPRMGAGHALPEHERLVLEAYTLLRLAVKEKLAEPDTDNDAYTNLDVFLHKMNKLLSAMHHSIAKAYFMHAQMQKQLFIDNEAG